MGWDGIAPKAQLTIVYFNFIHLGLVGRIKRYALGSNN